MCNTSFHFRHTFLLSACSSQSHATSSLRLMSHQVFCTLLPHWQPKKPKSEKKRKKTSGDIIILHMYTNNYDHMMHSSWDMVHDGRMDIQTDRYIEVTERGTPPKKSLHTFFRGCSEKLLFESFQRFPENYLK